jgi:5-oxoprolinase (ATP-hydrolysing)
VILHRFEYRPDSGGAGRFRGGDGLVREFEYTIPCHASVLTQRRVYSPYGMAGGADGLRGENRLGRKMKDGSLRWVNVGGTKEVNLNAKDRIAIYTPGGGGYGRIENGTAAPHAISVESIPDLKEPQARANGRLSAWSAQVASSF